MVITVAIAGTEVQFGVVARLRHLQQLLLICQQILLFFDLRLEADGVIVDQVGGQQTPHVGFDRIHLGRCGNVKPLFLLFQFQTLSQVEECQLHIVGRFGACHFIFGQLCLDVVQLGEGNLSVVDQGLCPLHLFLIQGNLQLGNLQQLFVVEYLQVGGSNLDGEILFSLVECFHGSLQVQLAGCNVVVGLHAIKERHVQVDIERGVGCILIHNHARFGAGTSELEALSHIGIHSRQPGSPVGLQLHLPVGLYLLLLFQGDIVFDGIPDTLFQCPRTGWLLCSHRSSGQPTGHPNE